MRRVRVGVVGIRMKETIGGPKAHINMRISHSGSKARYRGVPEILFCRILMFM